MSCHFWALGCELCLNIKKGPYYQMCMRWKRKDAVGGRIGGTVQRVVNILTPLYSVLQARGSLKNPIRETEKKGSCFPFRQCSAAFVEGLGFGVLYFNTFFLV